MSDTLTDSFGRHIEYVRVSVTDRCDLRCSYCMPKGFKNFETPDNWLSFAEIEQVMRVFSQLGVKRIRLTGGEPLVRHQLADLVARLSAIDGLQDISLSTNATRLAKQAQQLYNAGIQRINVSLDTLQADRFKTITGGNLQKVLDGLQMAKQVGIQPIKINMVVMRGINDDEIEAMLEYCLQHDFTLRFIETMPVGESGLDTVKDHYIDLQTIKERLCQRYQLIPGVMPGGGPANYMQLVGTSLRIGFITPMSQHFCETCNRVRLAVDGTLYLCLGQDNSYALRPLLRQGITDDELKEHILKAINLKPERHEFSNKPEKMVRFMSMTGG